MSRVAHRERKPQRSAWEGQGHKMVQTFAEGVAGEPVVLIGSSGYLEISVNQAAMRRRRRAQAAAPKWSSTFPTSSRLEFLPASHSSSASYRNTSRCHREASEVCDPITGRNRTERVEGSLFGFTNTATTRINHGWLANFRGRRRWCGRCPRRCAPRRRKALRIATARERCRGRACR